MSLDPSVSTSLQIRSFEIQEKTQGKVCQELIYLPIVVRDIQKIIVRLAFGTMSEVSQEKCNFEYFEEETPSEIYKRIKILGLLTPQVRDVELSANARFLEWELASRVGQVIISSWVVESDYNYSYSPCRDEVNAIILSERSFEDKLKALSSIEVKRYPVFHQIAFEMAELMVRHEGLNNADRDHILKSMIEIIFTDDSKELKAAGRIVKLAIELGADPNRLFLSTQGVMEPLLHRCINYNLYMMSLLIAHGANIEGRDDKGNTLLHKIAVRRGHWRSYYSLLQYLRSVGADIEARNKNGETPIFCAIQQKSWEAAEALVYAGADLSLQDALGKTLLEHARENYYFQPYDVRVNTFSAAFVLRKIEEADRFALVSRSAHRAVSCIVA